MRGREEVEGEQEAGQSGEVVGGGEGGRGETGGGQCRHGRVQPESELELTKDYRTKKDNLYLISYLLRTLVPLGPRGFDEGGVERLADPRKKEELHGAYCEVG